MCAESVSHGLWKRNEQISQELNVELKAKKKETITVQNEKNILNSPTIYFFVLKNDILEGAT